MEVPKDLTILDLIVLEKIEKDSLMESFSGKLYSSFFETASILGTLQVKQLVSISSAIGRNVVNRSELGEKVLIYAQEKSTEPLDGLDHVILKSIAAGNRTFEEIKNELNLRSDDLAIHLYKVIKQGYADYEIRAGKLTINITEKGFKITGYVPKRQLPYATLEQKAAQTQGKTISTESKQPVLDIKAVFSQEDATPVSKEEFLEERKRLSMFDKIFGKLSFFVSKYAPFILILILIVGVAFLYLSGYLVI